MSSEAVGDSAADSATVPGAEDSTLDREVITTGWVSLVAADPAQTAEDIATMVETAGGWVESRSQTAGYDDVGPSSSITVRLPSDRVSDTVAALNDAGEVEDVSVDSVDVTATGQDLDARIGALTASVSRLTELIADAETTADLIAAESELTTRQAELDALTSQRASLTEQVAMSTLTVSISAESPPSELTPGGFLGGISRGWSALVTTANVVVVVLGAVLPWLIPVALVYIIVRIARRRRSTQDPGQPPRAGDDAPRPEPDSPTDEDDIGADASRESRWFAGTPR